MKNPAAVPDELWEAIAPLLISESEGSGIGPQSHGSQDRDQDLTESRRKNDHHTFAP
jgi:hypothetical protein